MPSRGSAGCSGGAPGVQIGGGGKCDRMVIFVGVEKKGTSHAIALRYPNLNVILAADVKIVV